MKKKKFSIELLATFAIFNYPVIIGSIPYVCYAFVYGIPLIYIVFNYGKIRPFLKKFPISILRILAWTLLALLFCIFFPIVHNTNDYSYVNVILGIYRRALVCIFLFLLVSKKYQRNEVVEEFMMYYSLATMMYVFSTVLFIFFPAVKSFWIAFIQMGKKQQDLLGSYGYAGRFGWAGFSGFRNTIDCTLSIVFLTYLFAYKRLSPLRYVIYAFIVFIGNMFYGRSGLLASVLCVVTGLVLYKKIRIRLIFEMMITLTLGIVLLSFLREHFPSINEWVRWATTPFVNFIKTGSFNNYSANRLLNEMIFIPSRKTMLIGDGLYTDPVSGHAYMRTDSGFMRQILFWGVLVTSTTYFAWLMSLLHMKRDLAFKILLIIMCILFEIKGEAYYELMPLFAIIATIDKSQGIPSMSC